MYRRLFDRAVGFLLKAAHRILPRLNVDARLAAAAGILGAATQELEASQAAVESGEALVRETTARLTEATKKFGGILREFAMVILAAGGNRHHVQPYVIYFPDGYGDMRFQTPKEMVQFANQVTTLLERETDPKLAAYGPQIANASAEFVPAQQVYEAAVRSHRDALAYRKVSRRRFVRALAQARNMADAACGEEPAYIRAIFAPVATRRRRAGEAEETEEAAAAPQAAPVLGVTPSAPAGGAV